MSQSQQREIDTWNTDGIDNEPLPFFPAGLELLHSSQSTRVTSDHHAFFLAVHWILMRAGLRRVKLPLQLEGSFDIKPPPVPVPINELASVGAGSSRSGSTPVRNDQIVPVAAPEIVAAQITEMPAEDWAEKMNTYDNDDPIKFQYLNPLCPHEGYYTLTLYKMPMNSCLIRLTNPYCPASRERHLKKGTRPGDKSGPSDPSPVETQGYTAPIGEFVHTGPNYPTAYDVYYRVPALERVIFHMLGRMGLRLLGYIPKSINAIYDDKTTPSKTQQDQHTQQSSSTQRRRYDEDDELDYYGRPLPNPGGIGGPLHVPPVGGGGGLGRSDLDPLGRIGAGMIADPRGFRRPQTGPPGMLPPGARFDPFGPIGPNPPVPGRMGGPPGPGPRPPPFAGPNPDEPPPPDGFNDMFM